MDYNTPGLGKPSKRQRKKYEKKMVKLYKKYLKAKYNFTKAEMMF